MKLKILILIAVSLGVYLCFTPRPSLKDRLILPAAYTPITDPLSLSEEEMQTVNEILAKPFVYLGKGTQAYVFVSDDDKYVLKFMKQHPSTRWFPKKEKQEKHQRNYVEAVHACALSWKELKEQTALLYIHMEPTEHLHPPVTLSDRKGKTWEIPLDKTCFLIQKKADLVYPHFDRLLSHGNVQGTKEAIRSIIALFKDLEYRGVIENDPVLRKNFGFIGNQAVQIDCGTMKIDPAQSSDILRSHGMRKNVRHLKQWIQDHYPQFTQDLDPEFAFDGSR